MVIDMNLETQPIRILQVVTYMGRGGIETMLMNYYRRMDRTKIQFDFLVHRDFRADYDDEIESLGGKIYRLPPLNPASITYRRELRKFFRTHPYKVVHCHLNYMSGLVLAEAKRVGVPHTIAHAHNTTAQKNWKYLIKRLSARNIPKYAGKLFACGQQAGNAIFGGNPFVVLPNAIDAEKYRYSESVRLRKRIELGLQGELTIIHVGRFDFQKNHSFLIDLFAQLVRQEPSAKLLLAGDGELRPAMEERAARLLPEGSVRFLGVRKDIPHLLQAADVFVFPSFFEGLPVTMVEAQAAGLPCIKSDTITDECIVTDLVTSLPITDPILWAEEILQKRGFLRTDRLADIQTAGYDITTAADKLTRFYLNGETL